MNTVVGSAGSAGGSLPGASVASGRPRLSFCSPTPVSAAPGTAYLATGGSAETGAGEQKLNLGRPLATLAPGSEPPALPADPNTVFTTACPISPPKTPFALSRTRT